MIPYFEDVLVLNFDVGREILSLHLYLIPIVQG